MHVRPAVLALAIAAPAVVVTYAKSSSDVPAAPTITIHPATYGMRVAPVALQSAGVMHFGPDGVLFVADSRNAAIYAIDVADQTRDTSTSGLRLRDVDAHIATALGTTKDQIRIRDMAVHPASQAVYFAIAKGMGEGATPVLVRVAKGPGNPVTVVSLDNIRHSRAAIPDAAAPEERNQWGQSKRQLSVTDLALSDGELYVAGLSNARFASSLRRIPYPFREGIETSAVEIYHTAHDKWETASPIETLLPITLAGQPSVLAAYSCSPLAVFSRAALRNEKHIKGKTVAELGGGNRPFDMTRYVNAKGKEYILIANSDRTLMRVDPSEVASAAEMKTPVTQAWQPAGVGYLPVAEVGVMQLDLLNKNHVLILKRDTESGSIELQTLDLKWL
jgi:hypothetical protein